MVTSNNGSDQTAQPRRGRGRPTKLTPELQETIIRAIAEDGCTYADACRRVRIAPSTFGRWKQKGEEQTRGKYSAFCTHLKKAESDYRAYYLKKIQDAANESSVETRKTVRTDGDGETTFQEVVEFKAGSVMDCSRLAARAQVPRGIQP